MTTANDFFPAEDTATWRFVERNSSQEPVFSFRARRDGDQRRVELDAPGFTYGGFFDRMTITPVGLELNRIHFANEAIDIPPWLLTLGPEPDRVENVLPTRLSGLFGEIRDPFVGVTTAKTVTDGPGGGWTIEFLISGVGPATHVLKGALRFAAGVGLCEYRGQTFGNFFFHYRRDEPACGGGN